MNTAVFQIPGVLEAVRAFLVDWIELKATLKDPPSPLGRMLEIMTLGTSGAVVDPETGKRYETTRDGYMRSDSANERMASYAHHAYVLSCLTETERRVVVASVMPVATVTVDQWAWFADLKEVYTPLYELERGKCNAPTVTGHPCRKYRLFGEPRCETHRDVKSRPLTHVTRGPDPAELIGEPHHKPGLCYGDEVAKWDGRPRDANYELLPEDPGRVRVARERPIYASEEYIADLLQIAPKAVREAGRLGRQKLIDALLEEAQKSA